MRRRPRRLQVSLFPFLSVLLCTLGALILLLLVLDQKARQQKAAEIALQREAARQAADDRLAQQLAQMQALARQQVRETEDRERQEAALLRHEREQLAESLGELHSRRKAAEELLRQQQQHLAELERQLLAEQRTASQQGRAAQGMTGETESLRALRQTAQSELARLQEQLRLLEEMVARLQKAAQEKRQPMYSLVPYKGRLGTNRRPIYLECVNTQVIFHPDRGQLWLADLQEPGRLQKEIEQRAARLARSSDKEAPYALLLIRPSGIPLYYGIVRALQNSSIDLGYEFIEEDWKLDFTEPSPEMVAAAERASLVPAPAGGSGPGRGNGAGGSESASPGTSPGRPALNSGSAGMAGSGTGPGGRPGGEPLMTAPLQARLANQGAGGGRPATGTPGPVAARPPTAPAGQPGVHIPQRPPEPGGAAGPQGDGQAHATGGQGSDSHSGSQGQPAGTQPPPEQTAGGPQPSTGASQGGTTAKRGIAPTPVGIATSRDWVIVLECTAEEVVIHPQRIRISRDQLLDQANPLLAKVQLLLQQRANLASRAPPQLRYYIRPDGLRTYYQAAGALDSLKLKATAEMLREGANVEDREP